jgi:hypothetical protein
VAFETMGRVSSGHACIIEVKQPKQVVLARQQQWMQALCQVIKRPGRCSAEDSLLAEQILALP